MIDKFIHERYNDGTTIPNQKRHKKYKMKRIVIETGSDFAQNKGDEAYFAVMVAMFKERMGKVEITKFANNFEEIMQRYSVKAIYSGGSFLKRLKSLIATMQAILECDLYVWGGGQLLHDSTGIVSVLYRLARPFIAKLFRKSVIAYAVGIGPLETKLGKLLARTVLNLFDVITVRDGLSKELLRAVGVIKPPIHVTVDPAIALLPAKPERINEILTHSGLIHNEKPLIAVLPFGPAFRSSRSLIPTAFRAKHNIWPPGGETKYKKHVLLMAEACDYMVTRLNANLVFIAMDTSITHGGDDKLAANIIHYMKHKDKTIIIRDYTPEEIGGILSKMALVIGSRMHGLILASGMMVPVVGIGFSQKMRSFARIIAQEKYFINVEDITTVHDLTSLIDTAWFNRDQVREEIKAKIMDLRRMVKYNVSFVLNLLNERKG